MTYTRPLLLDQLQLSLGTHVQESCAPLTESELVVNFGVGGEILERFESLSHFDFVVRDIGLDWEGAILVRHFAGMVRSSFESRDRAKRGVRMGMTSSLFKAMDVVDEVFCMLDRLGCIRRYAAPCISRRRRVYVMLRKFLHGRKAKERSGRPRDDGSIRRTPTKARWPKERKGKFLNHHEMHQRIRIDRIYHFDARY